VSGARWCSKISDVRVPATSAHHVVVVAGEEVHVAHLGAAGHPGHELGEPVAGVGLQADRDHGLQGVAGRRRVDVGVVAADHPALAQRPDAAEARRRRDPRARGE
jgi:hypothetical protein